MRMTVCAHVCMYIVCKRHSTYIRTCVISLQLDAVIGHEMTCQYEQALGMYNDLHLRTAGANYC